MKIDSLRRISEFEWMIEPRGSMRVPGVVFATEELIAEMDDKVHQQVANVASLPGIVRGSYAMPDAHWGYGFPIGGVAAFDRDRGGVISAGGVGFDISCGVRTLTTNLSRRDIVGQEDRIAETLFQTVPAGLGSTGHLRLEQSEMEAMLSGGAEWAVERGYGHRGDLERIEERGRMAGAVPDEVSDRARHRQRNEMGTLGSGNHYLEVQEVSEILDDAAAAGFGLRAEDIVVSIHCGSRGLGHQIGTEFLRTMAAAAGEYGIKLPDRELACAPLDSPLGQSYLGAMRAGINCALANRQILTQIARDAFAEIMPSACLEVLYDVSHNTCKEETHWVDGEARQLFVHRKGATRSLGPGHPDLPPPLCDIGQPVLIGGSMGTASYILVGMSGSEERSFASACHGAGRAMSRHQAKKRWQGKGIVEELAQRGIRIRSRSMRGVAEEAPGAYKDVTAVVEAAEKAGLARRVARLTPVICVKG